ncbi:MAG: bacillithiol biosynthesis deacetylase BshB1 [Bacteroidota bacterium]
MNVDILAIGVHPDDVELGCSGTLLKHIAMGKTVGIVDLTKGELGTRGNAELRLQEAENARRIMGAAVRENLGMADGFFQHNEENILKISKVIRKYKPQIVLANAISDRHPDHGRAAKLTSDACFYSGLARIQQKNANGEVLTPWRPKAVYHYIQDHNLKADFVVDISEHIEKKFECILAFSSQFSKGGNDGPQTPISGKDFMDFMKAKNRAYARQIGVEYAEGFTVDRDLGIRNLFDLI